MRTLVRILTVVALALLGIRAFAASQEPNLPALGARQVKAVVIPCRGMIDDGLFQSIKRRTEQALDMGASYIIYEISTYGGRLDAADNIAKYFIHDIGQRARTIAYISSEAISAGALISVSCDDIIMRENTTIGNSAPVMLEGQLEGVEREKAESFLRAAFQRAAESNNYPAPLLRAMVTQQVEVYRVRNIQTGALEFFEGDRMPVDANQWDLGNKELIDGKDTILTLTATQAYEYGIARAVVEDIYGALAFLEERDNVVFDKATITLETNWSEELVRWLNSPAVTGILFMIGLLGIYVELQAPGLGLPGLAALIAFLTLFGSRYLIGLANYVEVIVFFLGLILLAVEIFVLPGFGLAGAIGSICILAGLFGMLLPNDPGQIPWPTVDMEWEMLRNGVISLGLGFVGFLVIALLLARYMPRWRAFSGLILAPPVAVGQGAVSMTTSPEQPVEVKVGDEGEALTALRPAGRARFGTSVVDVVAQAEFLEQGTKVRIAAIHGNRVVVRVC
ncbi:MAG TPA: NfeD family protein [Sedimentisphaerales bacterium]|nr:NfeD family protein [Sedimentisphaerales bacterium]